MPTNRTLRPHALLGTVLLLALAAAPAQAQGRPGATLLTPSEASGWETLSNHLDVTAFYRELQVRSPEVRVLHLGTSREGRELLTVTVARPAVTTPAEAHATGKPIVFIGAQVHGDEPGGKEGLMLFARELALGSLQELLDDVVFVFVPQINPDAAEAGTWGTRTNPSGYNLNRDYSRLNNNGASDPVTGLGGMMTEVRVYHPGNAVPLSDDPNQTFGV